MTLSTIPTRALTEQGINFRNIIINGDMSIAQRGTSKAGVNTSEYNSVDRFEFGVGNTFATFTTSQDTDSPNEFSYSAKLDCTTSGSVGSTGFTRIRHKIEGQFLQSLAFGTSDAKAITLSFYIKSNQTGNFVVNFRNFNSSQQRCANKIVTINSANTWEYKSMTVSGDTVRSIDNNNGYEFSLEFWFNGGSSYTSGATSASFIDQPGDNFFSGGTLSIGGSTDDYVNLTGVQLEVGTTASDFEFIPFDVNLQRCQRYYYAHEDNVARVGRQLSNTECGYDLPFPNIMRTTPTVTYNSPSNDLVQVNGNNQSPTGYDSARSTFGTKSAFLALDYSSNGAGNNVSCKVILSHSATSKKEFDAEL